MLIWALLSFPSHQRPPLELTFGELGNFGTRLVFINLTNVEELETLRQDMNAMLKDEGILLADNRFTPHVTLFRSTVRHLSGSMAHFVSRKDIPSVAPSPLSKIVFQKLRG